MKNAITVLPVVMLFFMVSYSHCAEPYQVVFETTDCSGNIGFSTVGPEQIYKIENGDCSHPDNPGQKLKNMLVHDGNGSYRVFTLTQEEARNVMRDVKDYMNARKGVLDKSNTVIITQ